MRIAIVAESFLPRVNGVTNSVIQTAKGLTELGHEVLIIAPDSYTLDQFEGLPVTRVRSIEVPGIHETDIAVNSSQLLTGTLRRFRPDVVHLASPFVLGAAASKAARNLGIPVVAVFQTDIAGFAGHYGLGLISAIADVTIRRVHRRADLNLAPSTQSREYLNGLGVHNVALWGRGVNLEAFNPKWRDRSDGAVRVGYLGRLAPEKRVGDLSVAMGVPDVELVVIGDGPSRLQLQSQLPTARFTGRLTGADLSREVANLDVLIAPGEKETFCQVVQEAMAAAVPVLAPAVGGPKDLVRHGHNGFLYAPGDMGELRAHLLDVVGDAYLRQRLSSNAFDSVQDRTWPTLVTELVWHYASVVAARELEAV